MCYSPKGIKRSRRRRQSADNDEKGFIGQNYLKILIGEKRGWNSKRDILSKKSDFILSCALYLS